MNKETAKALKQLAEILPNIQIKETGAYSIIFEIDSQQDKTEILDALERLVNEYNYHLGTVNYSIPIHR